MTWAICRASVSRQGHSHPWKVGGGSESQPATKKPYCKRQEDLIQKGKRLCNCWSNGLQHNNLLLVMAAGWIWSFDRMLIDIKISGIFEKIRFFFGLWAKSVGKKKYLFLNWRQNIFLSLKIPNSFRNNGWINKIIGALSAKWFQPRHVAWGKLNG